MTRPASLLLAGLLIALSPASRPAAADPASDAASSPAAGAAREVYGSVMSPFCPGRLLVDCPTSEAKALKTDILTRLESGEDKDAVVSGLADKYGEEILALPPFSGFGLLAWLVPAAAIAVGLFALLRVVRPRSTDAPGRVGDGLTGRPDAPHDADELRVAELEKELERRR